MARRQRMQFEDSRQSTSKADIDQRTTSINRSNLPVTPTKRRKLNLQFVLGVEDILKTGILSREIIHTSKGHWYEAHIALCQPLTKEEGIKRMKLKHNNSYVLIEDLEVPTEECFIDFNEDIETILDLDGVEDDRETAFEEHSNKKTSKWSDDIKDKGMRGSLTFSMKSKII